MSLFANPAPILAKITSEKGFRYQPYEAPTGPRAAFNSSKRHALRNSPSLREGRRRGTSLRGGNADNVEGGLGITKDTRGPNKPGTAVYNRFQPADITQAGGLSPYGTMGQGGNVFEWEETAFDLFNNAPFESRGFRGGSYRSSNPYYLSSSHRRDYPPNIEADFIGFRVASIPEPSSLLLGAFASVGLWMRRRRQVQLSSGKYSRPMF